MKDKALWFCTSGYNCLHGTNRISVRANTKEEALKELLYRVHMNNQEVLAAGGDVLTVLFTETLHQATAEELRQMDENTIAWCKSWDNHAMSNSWTSY